MRVLVAILLAYAVFVLGVVLLSPQPHGLGECDRLRRLLLP